MKITYQVKTATRCWITNLHEARYDWQPFGEPITMEYEEGHMPPLYTPPGIPPTAKYLAADITISSTPPPK